MPGDYGGGVTVGEEPEGEEEGGEGDAEDGCEAVDGEVVRGLGWGARWVAN